MVFNSLLQEDSRIRLFLYNSTAKKSPQQKEVALCKSAQLKSVHGPKKTSPSLGLYLCVLTERKGNMMFR